MSGTIGLLLMVSWLAAAGCGWCSASQQAEASASIIDEPLPPCPSAAMDVDAAPIAVELSDFGEATAPKNDLMATIGWFPGTGIVGRGAPLNRPATWFWSWIRNGR